MTNSNDAHPMALANNSENLKQITVDHTRPLNCRRLNTELVYRAYQTVNSASVTTPAVSPVEHTRL